MRQSVAIVMRPTENEVYSMIGSPQSGDTCKCSHEYSCFRVSSPKCTWHTRLRHVNDACIHVSNYSVQYVNEMVLETLKCRLGTVYMHMSMQEFLTLICTTQQQEESMQTNN